MLYKNIAKYYRKMSNNVGADALSPPEKRYNNKNF